MTDILHHLARLEMMMAEERGIDLSYTEAREMNAYEKAGLKAFSDKLKQSFTYNK